MSELEKAIEIVRSGGIIIFPTDTAFGIGCRIDREDSLKKLFEIRRRSEKKAVPVLFDSVEMVKNYLKPFDMDVENLMNEYWPGALTLILNCDTNKVLSVIRGGGKTLGVRIPDYKPVRNLIAGVGVPIVGTSANFAGGKTPFSLEGLDKELIKLVDFVLEGETKGKEKSSTVLDCTKKPWEIIRQGNVVPDL